MRKLLLRAAKLVRVTSVVGLLLVFGITASAYTLVLRGGRRVEIPAQFLVTKSTVTYEVAEGIQVTVQIAAVDIQATERANNEAPGSFLRRVVEQAPQGEASAAIQQGAQTSQEGRSLTNRDLERFAKARRESELVYNRRLQELGLPSLEESRRRSAAESERIQQELEEKRAKDADLEASWRARGLQLRSEIAAADAEIVYLRGRISELSLPSFSINGGLPVGFAGPITIAGGVSSNLLSRPVGPAMVGAHQIPQAPARPPIFVAPGSQMRGGGGAGFPRPGFRGQFFNGRGRSPVFGGFGTVAPFFPAVTGFGGFGYPFSSYDPFYERSQLVTRLDEVNATRLRLAAQLRVLEDEARRAGVPPGWLR